MRWLCRWWRRRRVYTPSSVRIDRLSPECAVDIRLTLEGQKAAEFKARGR